MRKPIFVLTLRCSTLLLASSLFAQTTTVTSNNGTTKVTEPDTTQTTVTCGDAANVDGCYITDTTIEAATSHRKSRRRYFKSIQKYCKQHKGMKWKDCKKAVGPYIDPSL